MFIPRLLAWLVLLSIVSACGGGGGSDGGTSTPPPSSPAPPDTKPGGIWSGQTTNDAAPGVTQDLIGVTTDAGEFRFLSLSTAGQFIGSLTVSGDNATGTGLGWAPFGSTWTDGTVLTNLDISAEVTERQQFTGTWTAGTGESGTFTFAYEHLHERTSSLSKLSANWFYTDGPYSLTISIDASGAISGSDTDGCVYSGTGTIPDAQFNTYALAFEITGCGSFNGSYAGLAVLDDFNVEDDTLIVSVDDGSTAIAIALAR